MAAAFAKLRGVALRLALVHYAATEVAAIDLEDEFGTANPRAEDALRAAARGPIPAGSMAAGIALAEWFEHEAARVYRMLHQSEAQREARRLLEWLERQPGRTARMLQRSNSRKYRAMEAARADLDKLVSAGVAGWRTEVPEPGRGGHREQWCELRSTHDASDTRPPSGADDPPHGDDGGGGTRPTLGPKPAGGPHETLDICREEEQASEVSNVVHGNDEFGLVQPP